MHALYHQITVEELLCVQSHQVGDKSSTAVFVYNHRGHFHVKMKCVCVSRRTGKTKSIKSHEHQFRTQSSSLSEAIFTKSLPALVHLKRSEDTRCACARAFDFIIKENFKKLKAFGHQSSCQEACSSVLSVSP